MPAKRSQEPAEPAANEPEDPQGAATKGPDEAFQKKLDSHGFGFHYAVGNFVQKLRTGWEIEAVEFPVTGPAGTTHIDLVLVSKNVGSVGCRTRMLVECKRPNRVFDLCFFRLPLVPKDRLVAIERLALTRRYDEHGESEWYSSAAVDYDNSWDTDNVYHSFLSVKNKQAKIKQPPAKGDPQGGDRTTLDNAVTQALRGASGLAGFLTRPVNRSLLTQVKGGEVFQGYVLPVVVTTARLWASEIDLAASNLKTGDVVPKGHLQAKRWVWLKLNISPDIKHALSPDDFREDDSLSYYLLRDYARCVAIVAWNGIQDFLTSLDLSHFADVT